MAAQNFFGLDIGTHSIKAVELRRGGVKPALVAAGIVNTPTKSLISESPEDHEIIADAIRKLREEARISTDKVVAALPESQTFTRVVDLPNLTENEVSSAIKWEAEQYVPVPLTEVQMDWQILSRPPSASKDEKMEVLLVAAPKILIEKYLKVLKLAQLTPIALETEITAVSRSLVPPSESSPTTLIISIGASTTDICVVRFGQISFTRSIATGGAALARAVAQDLGFEMDQAEEYKKTYGLDANQLEGKVMQAIKPIFDMIVNEIRRALAYYAGKHPNDSVKRAVLAGGTAKLPGIVVYLANSLGIEIQLGNPWVSVDLPAGQQDKLVDSGPMYAVAVGLALKDI